MKIRYSKASLKFLSKLDKKSVMRIREAINMLPDEDQALAYGFIKKLVKAWDPDFTKVTPEEAEELKKAEESGFVDEADIDWDDLQKYAD